MTSSEAEVFHKLRVATPLPSRTGHPVSVIFNGVNANSWLSPIGLSHRKQKCDTRGEQFIAQRPQTAGSIAIIRHHPKPTGLQRTEVLSGHHLPAKSEKDSWNYESSHDNSVFRRPMAFEDDYQSPINSYMFNQKVIKKGYRGGGFCDGPPKKPRPYTSIGTRTRSVKEHPINLELTVKSLEAKTSPDRGGQKVLNEENIERKHHQLLNVDAYEDLSRTCIRRAKSAPPRTRPTGRSKTPSLYWRAKSAYHRKLMTTPTCDPDTDHAENTQVVRGSMLRPLMYSSGSDIQHSAGCPYKCKGCFKACLVSQDYLEKAKRRRLPVRTKRDLRHRSMMKKDPRYILHQALARNQPIYKLVHGYVDEKTVRDAWDDGGTIRGHGDGTLHSEQFSVRGERGVSSVFDSKDDITGEAHSQYLSDTDSVDNLSEDQEPTPVIQAVNITNNLSHKSAPRLNFDKRVRSAEHRKQPGKLGSEPRSKSCSAADQFDQVQPLNPAHKDSPLLMLGCDERRVLRRETAVDVVSQSDSVSDSDVTQQAVSESKDELNTQNSKHSQRGSIDKHIKELTTESVSSDFESETTPVSRSSGDINRKTVSMSSTSTETLVRSKKSKRKRKGTLKLKNKDSDQSNESDATVTNEDKSDNFDDTVVEKKTKRSQNRKGKTKSKKKKHRSETDSNKNNSDSDTNSKDDNSDSDINSKEDNSDSEPYSKDDNSDSEYYSKDDNSDSESYSKDDNSDSKSISKSESDSMNSDSRVNSRDSDTKDSDSKSSSISNKKVSSRKKKKSYKKSTKVLDDLKSLNKVRKRRHIKAISDSVTGDSDNTCKSTSANQGKAASDVQSETESELQFDNRNSEVSDCEKESESSRNSKTESSKCSESSEVSSPEDSETDESSSSDSEEESRSKKNVKKQKQNKKPQKSKNNKHKEKYSIEKEDRVVKISKSKRTLRKAKDIDSVSAVKENNGEDVDAKNCDEKDSEYIILSAKNAENAGEQGKTKSGDKPLTNDDSNHRETSISKNKKTSRISKNNRKKANGYTKKRNRTDDSNDDDEEKEEEKEEEDEEEKDVSEDVTEVDTESEDTDNEDTNNKQRSRQKKSAKRDKKSEKKSQLQSKRKAKIVLKYEKTKQDQKQRRKPHKKQHSSQDESQSDCEAEKSDPSDHSDDESTQLHQQSEEDTHSEDDQQSGDDQQSDNAQKEDTDTENQSEDAASAGQDNVSDNVSDSGLASENQAEEEASGDESQDKSDDEESEEDNDEGRDEEESEESEDD